MECGEHCKSFSLFLQSVEGEVKYTQKEGRNKNKCDTQPPAIWNIGSVIMLHVWCSSLSSLHSMLFLHLFQFSFCFFSPIVLLTLLLLLRSFVPSHSESVPFCSAFCSSLSDMFLIMILFFTLCWTLPMQIPLISVAVPRYEWSKMTLITVTTRLHLQYSRMQPSLESWDWRWVQHPSRNWSQVDRAVVELSVSLPLFVGFATSSVHLSYSHVSFSFVLSLWTSSFLSSFTPFFISVSLPPALPPSH